MTRKQIWKSTSATLGMLAMLANTAAYAETAITEPAITSATATASIGAQYATSPTLSAKLKLTHAAKLALLQKYIKHVFVVFQENRSFDGYFGTYPGANGLFSTYTGANPADPNAMPANQTPAWYQAIRNTDGTYSVMHPFLSPRAIVDNTGTATPLYPESLYSVDHSHNGYISDFHLQDANLTVALNDGYALDQEGLEYAGAATASIGSSFTDANTKDAITGLEEYTPSAGLIVKGSNGFYPVTNGVAPTSNPSLAAKQKGEVAISHRDCDTVPFLWHYADVGTLFDNLHQTIVGPSTPNAIAILAAQSGATQWVKHPLSTGLYAGTGAPQAIPNETDTAPFAGSAADTNPNKPPYGPDEEGFATCATASTVLAGTYNNTGCVSPVTGDPALASFTTSSVVALDGAYTGQASPQQTLTFATLPLSFLGKNVKSVTASDYYPVLDLSDVTADINVINNKAHAEVPWGWYQQGFGPEPFDGSVSAASGRVVDGYPVAPHNSYIVHHNGPQYFGYLGDNPKEVAHMHGLAQFFTDVNSGALPDTGVFYIRGGYYNNDSLQTLDPSPAARTTFSGNDDHGSYSDSQISEALVADVVNAVANGVYWPTSAIIITYDESDGFYDHAPLAIRSWGPDGLPMSGGPRIPTIVISPYGASHVISHVYSEHGSIVSFIEELFGLQKLSNLPDEMKAMTAGATNAALNGPNGQAQTALGPNDGAGVGDLFEAFSDLRLQGKQALLPISAVTIPTATVTTLPHYGNTACKTLGIVPTDYPNGYTVVNGFAAPTEIDPPPADFNPRPTVAPGIPYLEQTIIGASTTSPWTP